MLAAMTALLASCGGSGVTTTTGTTGTGAGPNVASLSLSASSTSIPSDNSGTTTLTVTALSATNAAVPGVTVTLGADTGIISSQTVTTGTDGTASFTFRSGTTSLANRTATITASAGATAQIQIQIAGATLSVFGTTGSSVPNDGTAPVTVTFIAKNAQGAGLASTPFTASWVTTSGGQLTLSPTSGTTDANGKFSVVVSGTGAAIGNATLTATAAGASASATISVTAVAGTFGISQTVNGTGNVIKTNPTEVAMKIGDLLQVDVAAPTSTQVTFVTTQGTWVASGTTTATVNVGATKTASATLQQNAAGQANVQVYDPAAAATNTDNLTVGVTAVSPNSIILTASPTVVAKGSGTSTLIAKVVDANNQPVGDAAVSFSMANTTGGGESISPAVALTAAIAGGGHGLGEASTTFTAGSLSSSASGVQIRASVMGTSITTGTAPSGADASVVIGGTAGSIAFGIATKVVNLNTTTYQLPMSVLVSDANGNPVANTTVSLSAWPVAWATESAACLADFTDPATGLVRGAGDTVSTGTFYSEDLNGNLILDSGEDGYRRHFASGVVEAAGGTKDGLLTPVNSAGGSLPASVVTDANGLANFSLTYLKTSAIWTTDRIRASTVVQGTEAVSQITFALPAAEADVSPCYLSSPYRF